MESKILFKEEQKFTQWWLWLLLLVPFFFVIYNFFNAKKVISVIEENGNDGFVHALSETNIAYGSIIPVIILLLVLLLFVLMKLKTTIITEHIKMAYFPFFSKTWKWEDIKTANIITYGFVGYGIRISFKHGMVYNVKGNKGLALILKNGKKIVIGTQKPEELEKIIQGIFK